MKNYYNWDDALNGKAPTYNPYNPMTNDSKIREEKSLLRRLGILCGLALISYIIIQSLLYFIMEIAGLLDAYDTDLIYQGAVDIVLTVLGLFVPFAIFGRMMKKTSDKSHLSWVNDSTPDFAAPKSRLDFCLAILAGLGMCMLANIATSYLSVIMELFGYELSSPELSLPTSLSGIFITVLRVSVLAAFAEEICLRGYTMGSLRIFGDKTAILFSSVVFALMHGNLVQSPFALIAGFAIGYLTVKTRSMWIGIAIHALNNLLSVLVSYSVEFFGEEAANGFYIIMLYGLIFVGLFAFLIFNIRTRKTKLISDPSELTFGKKVSAFFLNPPMIIAAAYMLFVTGLYIDRIGS